MRSISRAHISLGPKNAMSIDSPCGPINNSTSGCYDECARERSWFAAASCPVSRSDGARPLYARITMSRPTASATAHIVPTVRFGSPSSTRASVEDETPARSATCRPVMASVTRASFTSEPIFALCSAALRRLVVDLRIGRAWPMGAYRRLTVRLIEQDSREGRVALRLSDISSTGTHELHAAVHLTYPSARYIARIARDRRLR